MKLFKPSLRNRFFFSLIILVFGASILIAGVTIYKYKDEARHYQNDKLKRKVASIEASINYQIENTTYPVSTSYIPLIFKYKIYEISHIHNTQIKLYDLNGNLLKTSRATFLRHPDSSHLSKSILSHIKTAVNNHYYYTHTDKDGHKYQSSYSYITDRHFKPLAILSLPHIESGEFMKKELHSFLLILGQVYLLLIVAAVILSYFFSRYITKSLNTVGKKIVSTRLDQKNQKILLQSVPREITGVIEAYNAMVDELEESAAKLASSEREQAWREMAKQVAHEIKNPLTPMRLTIQSFERNFKLGAPENPEKINAFSRTMIQQIDTMSAIASAFSDFAKMPKPRNERLNVPEVVKMAIDIFNDNNINFASRQKEIHIVFDRTQLTRIITNLIKNATQACQQQENPAINVTVSTTNKNAVISVQDNGEGIPDSHKNRIFEPKFTTKSSGMGLGLGIIKKIIENYNGSISFHSTVGKGTTFTVEIPLNNTTL